MNISKGLDSVVKIGIGLLHIHLMIFHHALGDFQATTAVIAQTSLLAQRFKVGCTVANGIADVRIRYFVAATNDHEFW